METQMTEGKKSKVKFSFAEDSDYKLHPATGAWGGPTPNGEIAIHFFVELQAFPDEVEMFMDKNGNQSEGDRKYSGTEFVRRLQTGVVLRPDVALIVGEWIVNNAKSMMIPQEKR
jgi:hypothetical protein